MYGGPPFAVGEWDAGSIISTLPHAFHPPQKRGKSHFCGGLQLPPASRTHPPQMGEPIPHGEWTPVHGGHQSVTVPIILSDTDTDTFFRYQIFPIPIPIPILFSGTKFFLIPIPVLFTVPNFPDTGSETFFRYQI